MSAAFYRNLLETHCWLVVLTYFNHLEKYERQLGRIIPYIMENVGNSLVLLKRMTRTGSLNPLMNSPFLFDVPRRKYNLQVSLVYPN